MFYHSQLRVCGLFVYDWVKPLKMPWATKMVLVMHLNLAERHVNSYTSFTNREIAESLAMGYSTVQRSKLWLSENGYVDKDGRILKNG